LLGAAKGDGTRCDSDHWMVSAGAQRVRRRPDDLHLRWAVGLLLVLACGFGIGLATGATRLASRRAGSVRSSPA
jgi:hypothetical protein